MGFSMNFSEAQPLSNLKVSRNRARATWCPILLSEQILRWSEQLSLSNAFELFLFLLLLMLQFYVAALVIPAWVEGKCETFLTDCMLEDFGYRYFWAVHTAKYFSLRTLTDAFDSKALPSRQYGVNQACKLGIGTKLPLPIQLEAVAGAVLIIPCHDQSRMESIA